jgi:hypothetical protein
MDRWLDHARCGPTFLRQPAMAQLVPTSIQYGSVSKLPGSLQAATAKRANLLLQRSGCFSGAANRFGKTRATIAWFATVMSSGASNDTSKATR